MDCTSAIKERQWDWARHAGLTSDAQGYLETVEANLRRPMCDTTRAAFTSGGGSELKKKMRALHSSSALAVNFFEYWSCADVRPLVRVLGLEAPVEKVVFEAQFRTGLRGTPPSLDICFTLASGRVVAIESKFTEWLIPKRQRPDREHFSPSYFKANLWEQQGLSKCQRLAEAIQDGTEHFEHLDAPQLLKHSLGLANCLGQQFDLYYINYDCPGPEARKHRQELSRFSEQVGDELRFKFLTYQALYEQLISPQGSVDPEYIDYLQRRYFSGIICPYLYNPSRRALNC